jgi:hypothetical protein
VQWTPLDLRDAYYGVFLLSAHVDGQPLDTSWGDAFIDSGTTFTYMASDPYHALRNAIEDYCADHDDCGGAVQHGPCWEVPDVPEAATSALTNRRRLAGFPNVTMYLEDATMTWLPEGYLFRKGNGFMWCYSFHDDGQDADTTLGSSWMLGLNVIFDMKQKRVGLAPADCPEYKKVVHLSPLSGYSWSWSSPLGWIAVLVVCVLLALTCCRRRATCSARPLCASSAFDDQGLYAYTACLTAPEEKEGFYKVRDCFEVASTCPASGRSAW